jgi:hypothetical protein
MIDLAKYAEILMWLAPIVIPLLIFMSLERYDMDKVEIAFWIIVTILLVLFFDLFCIIIINTQNYLDFE